MVMENPFEGKEIWFGVGSQDLYGEEALRQVAIHSAEMVDYLNNTGKIPAKIVLKPTLKSSDGVKEFMVEASANPNVIGVITWCHTFSPAKMWIRGLEVLTKPLLQLATQHRLHRLPPRHQAQGCRRPLHRSRGRREARHLGPRLRRLGCLQQHEGHALGRQHA